MYLIKDDPSRVQKQKVNRIFYQERKAPSLSRFNNERKTVTCFGCGGSYPDSSFPRIPQREVLGFLDNLSKRRAFLCQGCVVDLWKSLSEKYDDQFKAAYRVCSLFGWYYDDAFARVLSQETFVWDIDNSVIPKDVPWFYFYISEIFDKYKKEGDRFCFSFSDNFQFGSVVKLQHSVEGQFDILSDEDKKNRTKIMSIYHWDPFDKDSPEDRSRLYRDLLTISTEGIQEDLPKARAAIEIVRCYLRIDKINDALREMRLTVNSMVENEKSIKILTDQMKSETAVVSTLAKENGFSEIANKMKSRGVGTLTGIVQEMNQKGFDRGVVNKFDIDTTEAMRVVADISAESMFKQLSFTSADYSDMVKEQAEMIRKMQKTLREQSEELRLLKEEYLRQELVDRYRQSLEDKDLDPVEIERLVEEELKFIPTIEYKDKISIDLSEVSEEGEIQIEEKKGEEEQ